MRGHGAHAKTPVSSPWTEQLGEGSLAPWVLGCWGPTGSESIPEGMQGVACQQGWYLEGAQCFGPRCVAGLWWHPPPGCGVIGKSCWKGRSFSRVHSPVVPRDLPNAVAWGNGLGAP